MSDYAKVIYSPPPSKAELERRIARGEILRGSDAVLAAEYGLGHISHLMHDQGLVLKPPNLHSSKMLAKLRTQKKR